MVCNKEYKRFAHLLSEWFPVLLVVLAAVEVLADKASGQFFRYLRGNAVVSTDDANLWHVLPPITIWRPDYLYLSFKVVGQVYVRLDAVPTFCIVEHRSEFALVAIFYSYCLHILPPFYRMALVLF